jgi:preprotein translocase subunit SecG
MRTKIVLLIFGEGKSNMLDIIIFFCIGIFLLYISTKKKKKASKIIFSNRLKNIKRIGKYHKNNYYNTY